MKRAIIAILALLLLPSLAAAQKVDGCGITVPAGTPTCWKLSLWKGGQKTGRLNPGADPWKAAGVTTIGFPFRRDIEEIADLRYGMSRAGKPGYWPPRVCGSVWAESQSSYVEHLQWACEHVESLPPALRRQFGSPATHTMQISGAEVYDTMLTGKASAIFQQIKAARGSVADPPPQQDPPTSPPPTVPPPTVPPAEDPPGQDTWCSAQHICATLVDIARRVLVEIRMSEYQPGTASTGRLDVEISNEHTQPASMDAAVAGAAEGGW